MTTIVPVLMHAWFVREKLKYFICRAACCLVLVLSTTRTPLCPEHPRSPVFFIFIFVWGRGSSAERGLRGRFIARSIF